MNNKYIMYIAIVALVAGLIITPACASSTYNHHTVLHKVSKAEAHQIAVTANNKSPYDHVQTAYVGTVQYQGATVYKFAYMRDHDIIGECMVSQNSGKIVNIDWYQTGAKYNHGLIYRGH